MSVKYNNQFVDEKYSSILEPNLYYGSVFVPGVTFTDKYQIGPAGGIYVHKLSTTSCEVGKPGRDFTNEETSDELIQILLNNNYQKSKKIYGVQAAACGIALANENLATVGTVFGSLWNTTVFPSLQTFANHILPFFTQLGTESVSTFGVAFGEIKTIFDKVWTEGVAPVLSSLQTKWNEVWSILSEKWETYGKPIFEQLRAAWVNISNTVQTVWDKFIKPVWDSFMTAIDWLWDEHLAPFVDKLTDMLGKLISGALEIYNKVISPIVEWVLTVLLPPIRGAVQLIISICTSVFATITDIVSGIIRTISGIIDFVVGVFTGDWERAWNGIKDIFGGIFDSVKSTFTGVINVIIDAINFLFKKGTNVINKVINGLNRIHFTIPDWVPALGGKSLGFNISTLTEYQIPRLATGAVIPPNAEFAAILGDQKHGRNLEAPESLIRKIVKEESGAQLTVILQMPDGSQKTVFDTKAIKKTNRQSGKIIIPVEV